MWGNTPDNIALDEISAYVSWVALLAMSFCSLAPPSTRTLRSPPQEAMCPLEAFANAWTSSQGPPGACGATDASDATDAYVNKVKARLQAVDGEIRQISFDCFHDFTFFFSVPGKKIFTRLLYLYSAL